MAEDTNILRGDEKWIAEKFSSLDARLSELKTAQQVAFAAANEAVLRAEMGMDKRFDSVNEFREQLSDQTRTFLTKSEYLAAHVPLVDKVEKLSQPQWSLLISLLTAAVIAIGGFWTVLGLKIETAVAPITIQTERNAQMLGDERQRLDRLSNKIFGQGMPDK